MTVKKKFQGHSPHRYKDNPYAAIEVFNDASYRTGTFLTEAGNPDGLFPFEVIDQGTGQFAVALGQMSFVDLRQVTVTGEIFVGFHSMLRMVGDRVGSDQACSTVDGNITADVILALVWLRTVNVTGSVNLGSEGRLSGSTVCPPF